MQGLLTTLFVPSANTLEVFFDTIRETPVIFVWIGYWLGFVILAAVEALIFETFFPTALHEATYTHATPFFTLIIAIIFSQWYNFPFRKIVLTVFSSKKTGSPRRVTATPIRRSTTPSCYKPFKPSRPPSLVCSGPTPCSSRNWKNPRSRLLYPIILHGRALWSEIVV